jgi:alanyl-tRNA synthetase
MTSLCAGKMKALVLGGVPDSLTKTLPAGEWVKAALVPLGGKCGPNPKMSQGQGPNIQKLPEALEAAEAYAVAQLKGWS